MSSTEYQRTSTGHGSPTSRVGRIRRKARAYVALTKPQVIELLLVTTVPTMILAQRSMPSWGLIVATLIGGSLAAGSANAFNCYIDRDIDKIMDRTKKRPLVTGELTPREALVFASAIGVASLVVLGAINWLSAALAASAILFYVLVYTMVLKRRTPSNIVWGGAAGCMPVLIGWAAVTGRVDWAPIILFLVIFFWTPPHYWPLSIKYKDDYSAVDVPMLGAIETQRQVAVRIVRYSWVMVAVSLSLAFVAPTGWVYLGAAVVLGAMFLIEAHKLLRGCQRGEDTNPMRLFAFSITYLTLLFLAVAVDPFVGPLLPI